MHFLCSIHLKFSKISIRLLNYKFSGKVIGISSEKLSIWWTQDTNKF